VKFAVQFPKQGVRDFSQIFECGLLRFWIFCNWLVPRFAL